MSLRNWLLPMVNPKAYIQQRFGWPLGLAQFESSDRLLQYLSHLLYLQAALHGGPQKSWLKGAGLEFMEVREYVAGDDVRKMDWAVYARTLVPHVKEYHDERQVTLWLIVDFSPSMLSGSGDWVKKTGLLTKAHRAVELAGLIGLAAKELDYSMGCCIVTDPESPPQMIKPQRGGRGLQEMMQRLLDQLQSQLDQYVDHHGLDAAATKPTSNTSEAVDFSKLIGPHSLVYCLSDFMQLPEIWQACFGTLACRSQFASCLIRDSLELPAPVSTEKLPADQESANDYTEGVSGQAWLRASIGTQGQSTLVDLESRRFRRQLNLALTNQLKDLRVTLGAMGPFLEMAPDEPLSDVLRALFRPQSSMAKNAYRRSQSGSNARGMRP